MKPNTKEKRSWAEAVRSLWLPMLIGAGLLVLMAMVSERVWKDYRTALIESQTRQMELVVQSLADSIEFSLDEYNDRLNSAVAKVENDLDHRPTLARSDTLTDIWLEDNDGKVTYRCYGLTAVSDALITRTSDISYWQYHSGDTHYLVLKKSVGEQSVCLVVNSTALYQQLVSDIRVGTNGYVMIKNASDMVVMHPEAAQWGILPVEVCRLRQALLPQLLDRQGDLRRKTAALRAAHMSAAVAEAAAVLARRVRYLSLEIGSGGEVLERVLWERFGLTACGVGQAAVTVSFGGAPSGNTICLGEDCRRHQRVTYRLITGEMENEVPEQLLAVLFEAGQIKKEQIRVKTIEPNA